MSSFTELQESKSRLLTIDQASEILGVCKSTLEKWRSSGRYGLTFRKIGRTIFYHADDLKAFLERGPVSESRRPAPRRSHRRGGRAA